MDDTITCGDCFTLVHKRQLVSHQKWHEALADQIDQAVADGIAKHHAEQAHR